MLSVNSRRDLCGWWRCLIWSCNYLLFNLWHLELEPQLQFSIYTLWLEFYVVYLINSEHVVYLKCEHFPINDCRWIESFWLMSWGKNQIYWLIVGLQLEQPVAGYFYGINDCAILNLWARVNLWLVNPRVILIHTSFFLYNFSLFIIGFF